MGLGDIIGENSAIFTPSKYRDIYQNSAIISRNDRKYLGQADRAGNKARI
jgi:hypothetical protein